MIEFKSFAEFVSTAPHKGLGSTVDDLKKFCKGYVQALDMIDRVTKNKEGRPLKNTVDNINSISEERPTGTSQEAGLRRLRDQRPDLHEKVLHNTLSVHEACIEAGFRKKYLQVPVDPYKAAQTLRKHLSAEDIAYL